MWITICTIRYSINMPCCHMNIHVSLFPSPNMDAGLSIKPQCGNVVRPNGIHARRYILFPWSSLVDFISLFKEVSIWFLYQFCFDIQRRGVRATNSTGFGLACFWNKWLSCSLYNATWPKLICCRWCSLFSGINPSPSPARTPCKMQPSTSSFMY